MGIRIIEFKTEYRTGKDPVDWVHYTGTDSITESGQVAASTWERVAKLRPPEEMENDSDGQKIAAIRGLWAQIEPAYDAWRQGEQMPETGTPLAAWGGVSGSQIAALKGIGIKTIEDLAGVSDSNMKMILPNMRELRTMAKQWLDRRPEAEREAKLADLEAQNAAMMEMLAEMKALHEAKTGSPGGVFEPVPSVYGPMRGDQDAAWSSIEEGVVDPIETEGDTAPRRRGRPPKAEAA